MLLQAVGWQVVRLKRPSLRWLRAEHDILRQSMRSAACTPGEDREAACWAFQRIWLWMRLPSGTLRYEEGALLLCFRLPEVKSVCSSSGVDLLLRAMVIRSSVCPSANPMRN